MTGAANGPERAARDLMAQADEAIREGRAAESRALLEEAVQLLVHAEQLDEAIELCARHRDYAQAAQVAEMIPDPARAAGLWFRAGDLVRSAENRQRAGDAALAVELFERADACERAGALCEAQGDFIRAARLYERGGDLGRAVELLLRATADADFLLGAEAEEVCRRAAVHLVSRGRADEAIRLLRQVGNLSFAAELMAKAGRVDEAIDALGEVGDFLAAAHVAREAGDERRAQLLLAERAETEGRLEEAAGHHAIVGDHAAAARLYEFAGQLERAATAHEAAGAHEQAAHIWERLGRSDAATRCYRAAGQEKDAAKLEDEPLVDDASIERRAQDGLLMDAARACLTHAHRGERSRYADAEGYLTRIPPGHPDYEAAQALYAETLEQRGDAKAALAVLQRLLVGAKARPEQVSAFYQYGTLLEHEGFLAGARNAYRTAARFDPGYRDVSDRLARLREVDNRPAAVRRPSSVSAPLPPSVTMDLFDRELAALTEPPSPALPVPPAVEPEALHYSDVTSFEALLPPGPERPAGLVGAEDEGSGARSAAMAEDLTRDMPALTPVPLLRAEALAGRVLRGRFRIEKKLGRGSQAQVYLARDQVLDRKVAIKVLSESVADDPAALDRFLREARMAARVHHTGCLAIFDFGQEGGLTFMAMEYFRGRTLRDLIKKGPLDPYLAMRLARDVAAALGAVHDAGIVHRDVKPTNVMVDRTGRVRITDFGVARTLDDEDSGGMMVGTMKYMAPEQARGKEVDRRADIFSLGVVMYEMLNGKPPFGGTLDALIGRVAEGPPPLPSTVPVSDEIRRLVRRCMAKSPKQRYETVEPLVEDLSSEISRLKTKRRSRRRAKAAETARSAAVTVEAPAPPPEDEVGVEVREASTIHPTPPADPDAPTPAPEVVIEPGADPSGQQDRVQRAPVPAALRDDEEASGPSPASAPEPAALGDDEEVETASVPSLASEPEPEPALASTSWGDAVDDHLESGSAPTAARPPTDDLVLGH